MKSKVGDACHGDGRLPAYQNARSCRSNRDGTEGCRLRRRLQLHVSVEPSILDALIAWSAGLHVVLRVKMGAGVVRRADSVNDGEMLIVVYGFEGCQARV